MLANSTASISRIENKSTATMKIGFLVVLFGILVYVLAQNTTTNTPTPSQTSDGSTFAPNNNTNPRDEANNPANIVPLWYV
jgi:uncharacterized membrane protein